MWDHERATLIERLVKIYPYPKAWFSSLTTAQLIKIYNKPKKKSNAAKVIEVEPPQASHIRENPEDKGQRLVKTDGHGWEPIQ